MKLLIVDRWEGPYVICEDFGQKLFAIEISEVPKDAKAGSVIRISDEGEISVDEQETEKRRETLLDKQNRLKSR